MRLAQAVVRLAQAVVRVAQAVVRLAQTAKRQFYDSPIRSFRLAQVVVSV